MELLWIFFLAGVLGAAVSVLSRAAVKGITRTVKEEWERRPDDWGNLP